MATSGSITVSNTAASTALRGSAEDLSFALEGINSHSAELTIDTATTANTGIDYLSQLILINGATNGSITLTDTGATTTLQGTSDDLQTGLAGISSHTGNVIVNSASNDATTYLAHLKAINLATQGNILLANTGATADINGSSSDIISALNGVSDYIGTATVTTRLAISDADSIASKSTAVFSLGIGDTVANLVNADSSGVSTQLQAAVSDDDDVAIYLTDEDRSQWATDIDLIENASSGSLDLGLVNEVKLEDGVNPIFDHTTVSGKVLNFIDGTGNGVAGIVYIDGTADYDVIDLTYVTIAEDYNKAWKLTPELVMTLSTDLLTTIK